MGLIGVSDKGYPILAIPKKNTIKFSPAKIKANPLSKIEYERIQWEGIKKEKESKKGREARKQTKRKEKEINIKNMAKRIKNELNGGKNSITIETKNGFIRYDLDGKAHYNKELKSILILHIN